MQKGMENIQEISSVRLMASLMRSSETQKTANKPIPSVEPEESRTRTVTLPTYNNPENRSYAVFWAQSRSTNAMFMGKAYNFAPMQEKSGSIECFATFWGRSKASQPKSLSYPAPTAESNIQAAAAGTGTTGPGGSEPSFWGRFGISLAAGGIGTLASMPKFFQTVLEQLNLKNKPMPKGFVLASFSQATALRGVNFTLIQESKACIDGSLTAPLSSILPSVASGMIVSALGTPGLNILSLSAKEGKSFGSVAKEYLPKHLFNFEMYKGRLAGAALGSTGMAIYWIAHESIDPVKQDLAENSKRLGAIILSVFGGVLPSHPCNTYAALKAADKAPANLTAMEVKHLYAGLKPALEAAFLSNGVQLAAVTGFYALYHHLNKSLSEGE